MYSCKIGARMGADILLILQLAILAVATAESFIFHSCEEVLQENRNAPSGYYITRGRTASPSCSATIRYVLIMHPRTEDMIQRANLDITSIGISSSNVTWSPQIRTNKVSSVVTTGCGLQKSGPSM